MSRQPPLWARRSDDTVAIKPRNRRLRWRNHSRDLQPLDHILWKWGSQRQERNIKYFVARRQLVPLEKRKWIAKPPEQFPTSLSLHLYTFGRVCINEIYFGGYRTRRLSVSVWLQIMQLQWRDCLPLCSAAAGRSIWSSLNRQLKYDAVMRRDTLDNSD